VRPDHAPGDGPAAGLRLEELCAAGHNCSPHDPAATTDLNDACAAGKGELRKRTAVDLLVASSGYGVGSGRQTRRPDRSRFDLSPHLEAGAGGDCRRGPSMDGADDLAAVDALEVDAGDAEVGVSELTLYHDQRNAFVGHLDRGGVSQLVLVPTSAQAPLSRPDR